MTGPERAPAGELADELRRLLDAVAARAGTAGAPAAERTAGSSGTDCGWCPVCAVAAAVRGERPELTRRRGAHGGGLLTALRSLVEDHEHPDRSGGGHPSEADGAGAPTPTATPRVHRIAVRGSTSGTVR